MIPIEELSVVGEESLQFSLLNRTDTFVTIVHTARDTFEEYSLLVDPVTLQVEPDVNKIRANEEAARQAKYGKLDSPLYERLASIAEETEVPIVIWAAHVTAERSHEMIVAELIKMYPEAAKAQEQYGVPWAMEDTELSTTIEQKYSELSRSNIVLRLEPIIEWLRARAYPIHEFPGMPALSTIVPKRDIIVLAKHENVAQIHLNDPVTIPLLDQSIPTDRVPAVWSRGITGNNVKVAILERNKINPTASGCMNIIERGPTPLPTSDASHKSNVAAIAACNDTILRGVAYGAQIFDAAYEPTDPNWFVNALIWAVDTKSVDVVNLSEGQIGGNNGLYWHDRAFDYWVRAKTFTAAIAAGNFNNSTSVLTPAKGWNVITVGAFINKADPACNLVVTGGNANWTDDTMWDCSSYGNPTNGVEKPEVVAVANNTTILGGDRGTSYAAPQVTGQAALLMQRSSTLKNLPTTVKAIIMASAVHNIDGDTRLSDKDGAGGIDAALADQIAQTSGGTGVCSVACWWSINTSNVSPSINNSVDRFFHASQGERIRIAIAWFSQADSGYGTDTLLTNYNLYIYDANGNLVANSTGLNNSFEIVDFTAPLSNQYKIQIYRSATGDNNESSNVVGVAWVKDATYLPDLRNNGSGLTSSLYIRNNGAEPRDATITFNNSSGTPVAVATKVAQQPNALWLPTPPPNWQGSAIVNGGESLAVAVRNDGTGISTLDTGFVAGGSGDPAFEVASTTLYGPVAYNNIFGGLNSTIYLQNTSKDNNSVTVYFYGRTNYGDYTSGWVVPLNGNGSGTLSTSTVMGSTPWVGSVRIVAGQPVVAKIYESQGSTISRTYGAMTGGKSLMYVSAAYKNQFGLNTGLVIQNLHNINATNTITVTYCDRDNTACSKEPNFSLNAQRAVGINVGTTSALPAMWTGSIKIESKGGIPLGIVVTNANSSGGYDINGTNFGSKVVTLPWATYDPNNGRTTGYTLRNVSGQNNVTVIAKYYDIAGGNPVWTRTISPVNSAQVKGFFQNTDTLAVGWQGSIVLESTANIVAIMREDTTTTLGGYNGVPR